MKLFLTLSAFLVTCLSVAAQTQYRFSNLNEVDGLRKGAESIVQDGLGFLWIQHDQGISRFDGYEFKFYQHVPGDSLSLPRRTLKTSLGRFPDGTLTIDPTGNLWVISRHNGLYTVASFDRSVDGFRAFPTELEGDIINGTAFDDDGSSLWVSMAGKGLFEIDLTSRETHYYINRRPDKPSKFAIDSPLEQRNAIFNLVSRGDSLLLATWAGLWIFDKSSHTFHQPRVPAKARFLLTGHLGMIPEHSDPDHFWLLEHGTIENDQDAWYALLRVNNDYSQVERMLLPGVDLVSQVDVDNQGIFWVGTVERGLFRADPKAKTVINLRHAAGDSRTLSSDRLRGLTVDRNGNLWASTEMGLSKLPRPSLKVHNFKVDGMSGPLMAVYRTAGKEYLVSVRYGPQKYFEHEVIAAPIRKDLSDSLAFVRVANFLTQPGVPATTLLPTEDRLWVGTTSGGVASSMLSVRDDQVVADALVFHRSNTNNENTITSNDVTGIWQDNDLNIWVGTNGFGLNRINPAVAYGKPGSVTRFRHSSDDNHSLSSDFVVGQFDRYQQKSVLVTTASGVDLFQDGQFTRIFSDEFVNCVQLLPDVGLLVGADDGLFQVIPTAGVFRFLRLPFEYRVQDFQQDETGRLWITDSDKLISYDLGSQQSYEIGRSDGVEHIGKKIIQTQDGLMIVSDNHGFSLFEPRSLLVDSNSVAPVLTSLRVNNVVPNIAAAHPADNAFSIDTDITVLESLVLDYRHNNFSISFASMALTAPEKTKYRYKLEGYDRDWVKTDARGRLLTYTDLDAGDYTLRLQSANHVGIWGREERTLQVRILPPPWKSWWAYSLYGLVFLSLLLTWRRYEIGRIKLTQRASYLSEMDQLKSRLFANISHEFRTPLTLILGSLKQLQQRATGGDEKSMIAAMMRNGHRLLQLINQLLDFSKIEAGKMSLQAAPLDIVPMLREVHSAYESLAQTKEIDYDFQTSLSTLAIYADRDKIEKIVYNLLSNAFKLTPPGGRIVMALSTTHEDAVVTVRDSGIGISAEELESVFDRFYKVDSSQTRRHEGSGLGMALAKEFVDLHHGTIKIESIVGVGTTLTILLPLGKAHLTRAEIANKSPLKASERLAASIAEIELDEELLLDPDRQYSPVVLVVEDNADMRTYVSRALADTYQIMMATNGKDAFVMATEKIPDLILSNVMMPEMDGYELCRKIKAEAITSHIPVVLLTAKADRESKAGPDIGCADDYLLKPFDERELRLLIRNRIAAMEKARAEYVRRQGLPEAQKQQEVLSLDDRFLANLITMIDRHLDDENFFIEALAGESGYSRMQFYRKVQALTGFSPNQFVRNIRLQRAAEMLDAHYDKVSQIAYAVGFSSPANFNKCFEDLFGVTPSQYADKRVVTTRK